MGDSIPGLVSTLMTVRNGAPFIRQAVDSLLNQTDSRFEVIVVNDGSSDATQAILDSYDDLRLRVVTTQPMGRAESLRAAANHARGELLAVLDADDIALPHRLAAQRSFLSDHPEIALAGALAIEFGDVPDRIRPTPSGPANVRRTLGMYNPFYFSSICFRRTAYFDVGGFRVEDGWGCDKAFLVRVAAKYLVDIIPEPLIRYRVHEGQITASRMWRTRQHRASANIQLWAAWRLNLAPHLWPYPLLRWLYARLPAAMRHRRWRDGAKRWILTLAGVAPARQPDAPKRHPIEQGAAMENRRQANDRKTCPESSHLNGP